MIFQNTEETHKPQRNLEVNELSSNNIYSKFSINHLHITKSEESWKKQINSLPYCNSASINRKAFRDLETLMNILQIGIITVQDIVQNTHSVFSTSFFKICSQTNTHPGGGKSCFNTDIQCSYIYTPIVEAQDTFFEIFKINS